MKYALLGEAPNCELVARSPHLVLLPDGSGRAHTANRLLGFTGWDLPKYLRTFYWRTNLVPRVVKRPPSLTERRALAKQFILNYLPRTQLLGTIILGRAAAEAFSWLRCRDPEPLEWSEVGWHDSGSTLVPAVFVPHPSGRCRWWNSAENRAAARQFFEDLL